MSNKYMCFVSGRGKPSVIHVTREIAEAEAIRLSTLDPFHDVHVLEILSTIKASQECPAVVATPKKAKSAKPVKTEPIVLPEKKAPMVIVRKVRVPVKPS